MTRLPGRRSDPIVLIGTVHDSRCSGDEAPRFVLIENDFFGSSDILRKPSAIKLQNDMGEVQFVIGIALYRLWLKEHAEK